MNTIPVEIFALICSYVPPRVLGILSNCSSNLNKLVKSDAVLRCHKESLFKRWIFTRKIESSKAASSIYERIRLRIKDQNRWKEQAMPSAYILPTAGDKIATIKCKKNRLLVLSVTETKKTKISLFDLETLKLLATTETDLFRGTGNSTKILWKGGDWIVFVSNTVSVFAWNSSQNSPNRVPLESTKEGQMSHLGPFLTFDGHETLFYPASGDQWERRIYNLRTKESRAIDWIAIKDVYLSVNWEIRTLIYQKEDGKYYMEKFNADWKRTISIVLEVMDCYGDVSFKITPDYTFLFYSSQNTPARILLSRTGAVVLRAPINLSLIAKLRYSKDGFLIHQYRSTNVVRAVYSLKNNKLDQIQWITSPYSEKNVLRVITSELALIKYGKSIAFARSKTKTDVVSGGKLTAPFAKLIPAEYEKWNVMNTVLSETQIIFHLQAQNKYNALIVLDYCNSVVRN